MQKLALKLSMLQAAGRRMKSHPVPPKGLPTATEIVAIAAVAAKGLA